MKPTIMNFRDFMDQMVEVAEGRQVAPNFHGKRAFASPAARGSLDPVRRTPL